MSEKSASPKKRPLSPHLQVYKPQVTSVLSILHRMTGVGLVLGLFVFMAWLICTAMGTVPYDRFVEIMSSIPGKIVLFGWAWAVCYHACTGFRHLIWDMGIGYSIPAIYKSAYAVLAVSTVLTILVWFSAIGVFG